MEDQCTEHIVSAQKLLPSNYDPGWNDPPQSTIKDSKSPNTKRTLNKRVAFPFNSTLNNAKKDTNPPSTLCDSSGPPLLPTLHTSNSENQLKGTQKKIVHANCQKPEFHSDQVLIDTLENFHVLMMQHVVTETELEDIKKLRDNVKSIWLELESSMHEKIFFISKALRENNLDEVDKIYLALANQSKIPANPWLCSIYHISAVLRHKHQNFDGVSMKSYAHPASNDI